MNRALALVLFTLTSLLHAGCTRAAAGPTGEPPASPQRRSPGDEDRDAPATYADVIPEDAVADTGLFVVHRNDEELLFEIPDSLLGRDMLLISRIASVPANLGGFVPAGYKAHEQVLRWELRGERVILRKISYEQVADEGEPIVASVLANNFAPILASFDVEVRSPDGGAVVLDVTEFYEGDTPAISGLSQAQRRSYGVRRLDAARSFINFARAFPLNVDVRHTLTFDATEPPSDADAGTISMEMHQSMVLLPKEPMRPRYADDRVGYFGIERVNFGLDEQKAGTQRFIRRWRLEPTDPAAYHRGELVDPVKPIVYWLDPATPRRWVPCVMRGVEDWQAAFETAGFSNAIQAREAPSPDADPEWDPGDVRYSVVRWAASLTRNAQGPSVSDPRTGEILESDIVWYHNHLRSYRNRLMLETGAANPLARSLPIDDGLMCEAMRQVIAHEVGHALGLPHNMIASSAYPVDSLRVKSFAARMGVAPSIMDYARQNYIAQPGDGLEGADFIRQIGPYDHHAINWGYRIIADAPTPDAERPVLHAWIVERADDPVYRFQQGLPSVADPRAQTEDLGDDPVRASGYGIESLRAVTPRLVEWTSRDGEDYTDLAELYGELLGQWNRYVNHVASLIGGIYADLKTSDQEGVVYDPVDREKQEEALSFLDEQVFRTPTWLNDPDILRRIEASGGTARLAGRQVAMVNSLLSPARLGRMSEVESEWPDEAWPLLDYMQRITEVVWRDAFAGEAVDAYRRQLQRGWIERMESLMTEEPPSNPFLGGGVDVSRSDIRPLARAQLTRVRDLAARAPGRSGDAMTRVHLEDARARIDAILENGEGG